MTTGAVTEPTNGRRLPWLNTKLLIAAVALTIAVGLLIYTSMQGTVAAYFHTVGELDQQSATHDNQRVRVGGDVVPGTIEVGGPGEPIRFSITDGTNVMPVVYRGVMPDIFSDHVQVVVEGTYHSNAPLEADTLLTKCPSRFEATQTAQQE